MEVFARLVPASDFKSDGGCGDALPAGSIPVHFRHFPQPSATHNLAPAVRRFGELQATRRVAGGRVRDST